MIKKDISYLDEALIEDYADWQYQPEFVPWSDSDKWLLASCLQKAIRRGHEHIALNAAAHLYQLDKRMLQRRLLVTAFEDIGIANNRAVAQTTLICTHSKIRKQLGEFRAYLFAASIMARSIKCRAADQLYMICNNAEEGQEMREAVQELNINQLIACALAKNASLYVRAYAAQRLHKGCVCDAIEYMEQVHALPPMIDVSCVASSKMRDPLAVYTPMLMAEFQDRTTEIENIVLDESGNTIPLYAFDPLHTRCGKQAVKIWMKQTPELQSFTPNQIGKAVFHTESVLCDRELSSPELDDLKDKGVEVSLRQGGVSLDRHDELFDVVTSHMPSLNKIRADILADMNPSQLPLLK
ncbi:MAG: hypothetical protein AAF988_04325 [Pseudomonadota bacterium]